MALKAILVLAMLLAVSRASPTRRLYAGITEATASDAPSTNGETDWDDSEDFDTDGDDWFSKSVVSPSSVPLKSRQDSGEYEDDYSRGNVMVEFGEDDDEDDDEDEDEHLQDAEEDDGSRNDSEFLFLPPKDSRLMLEDDDDDQSGPIKVRHTGRSSYQHESDIDDNSLESMEDDKDAEEHPYEFTIDQDDKGSDEDDEEDERRADDSAETSPRHESHDDDEDDDELVSEGGEDDMFDNPAEESAQVIYGDHVLLY